MDGDLVLWGALPLGVAVLLAAVSVYALCRDFRGAQALLGAPVILLMAAAGWVLAEMMLGGWPSFVPHVAVVLAMPVVAVQVWLMRSRRPG